MCSVSRAVRIALHRRQRQRGKILVALPAAGLRVPLWSQRAFLSQRDEERLERRAAPGSSSSLKQGGTKFFLHLNTG